MSLGNGVEKNLATMNTPSWGPAQYTEVPGHQIAKALIKAQKEMGNAVKGAKNPFYKSTYADLNSIREVVLPVLNQVGIVVLQPTVHSNGRNFVKTVLLHESGEAMESFTEIICAKPNDPQAQGSAISYARRYGLQSFLNVGAVDDDGESAMDRAPKTKSELPTQDLTKTVVANAQAVIARKIMGKEMFFDYLGYDGDGTIAQSVAGLSDESLTRINKYLEGKLNAK